MCCYNDDVAFIHIPKAAGHSCRRYMAEHLDGIREIDDDLPVSAGHVALRDFETYTGRSPDSFQEIFAVIRDPYEHQLSQWHFWRDAYARGYRKAPYDVAAMSPNLHHWLQEMMADWHVRDPRPIRGMQKTTAKTHRGYLEFGGYYSYWLALEDGIPDNVTLVRFERLSADFPKALEKWVGGRRSMPHRNAGPRHDDETAVYYTPVARSIVEDKFKWTFDNGIYPRWGQPEAAA